MASEATRVWFVLHCTEFNGTTSQNVMSPQSRSVTWSQSHFWCSDFQLRETVFMFIDFRSLEQAHFQSFSCAFVMLFDWKTLTVYYLREPECDRCLTCVVFIVFVRFPLQDTARLQQWLRNMGRENWTPSRHQYICHEHFAPSCFRVRWGIRYLDSDAVPTIFQEAEVKQKDT